MAIVRRSPLDPYPVVPEYLAIRNQALHIPASQFSGINIKADEVFGVVVDMPLTQTAMVSLVCFINGACNLYFNNGGRYEGASQKYKTVVQAARNLVVNATPLRNQCKRTSQFPLPTNNLTHVYMLTKRGTFQAVIDPRTMASADKELRVVHYLTQQVMTALRLAQMRDAEGLPEGGKA